MDHGAVVIARVRKLDKVLHRLRRALSRERVCDVVLRAVEFIDNGHFGIIRRATGKRRARNDGNCRCRRNRKQTGNFFHTDLLRLE